MITRLLHNEGFGPEDIARLVKAYESCQDRLNLTDQDAKMNQLIARLVINYARQGVRNPDDLCERVVKQLS
jgi:hypothetical protein